ncbi:hypothetical protein PFMC_05954 [Plasmodium falciparum CAMP/Malaysia]|uniref:Uncharacterized protein n=1 Tax=Plasmodium falciparum (isolate Camp / Malaysia) TaxID=5835 RepID=A0A024WZ42_PLAFC|nr:hypothetical protein PFMC_05954 [Plasmodium falciparum CAMP/Malaysia]
MKNMVHSKKNNTSIFSSPYQNSLYHLLSNIMFIVPHMHLNIYKSNISSEKITEKTISCT